MAKSRCSSCAMTASSSAPIAFPQVGYLMVAEIRMGAPGLYDEIRLKDAEYAPSTITSR
jgi:hypothetical protein